MFICTAAVTGLRRALQLVYNKTVPPPFHALGKIKMERPLSTNYFNFSLYLLRELDGGRLAV